MSGADNVYIDTGKDADSVVDISISNNFEAAKFDCLFVVGDYRVY